MNEDENYLICKHCGVKLSKTAVVCYECKHLTSGEERPKRKKGFFSHLLGRVEKTEATRVKKGTAPTQQGLTAGEWNDKGLALAKSGRNQEAIQYFDKALELDPKNVGALVNKGTALYKLNRYQEALQCCYRALAIDPKNAKAQRLKTAELGKITTPQKEMAKNTTKTKVGKRAYLIFLYSTVPWPANERARLQMSIQQDEGCPVKTLGASV
jgi:tetratricopeptide (TPR) repeat protein